MSKLLDFLAPWWRTQPLADALAKAAGAPLDHTRATLTILPSYIDPASAPPDWLDWLMEVVGFYPARDLSEARKRNLIQKSAEIWRNKGTEAGMEAYAQALAGVGADIVDLNVHAFIAGISYAGDICGPGDNAWRFWVMAPASVALEVSVEALIEPVSPAFCAFLVNYV